jgi:periplasmic protein TonB
MAIARTDPRLGVLREAGHRLLVLLGAVALTFAFFIVLPLMQTISRPPTDDLSLQTVDLANAEPPPPPPPEDEEPEPEPEPEETPPQLVEEAPPLDLSQLELALNPGFGEGGGDFAVKLGGEEKVRREEAEAIFSLDDLDQAPRVSRQVAPDYPAELRQKKLSGTVYVIFIVSKQGRVEQAKVQKSTNPAFDAPALKAVKQWRFEPGRKNGAPVQFRMRVPITFAAQ